MGLTVTFDKSTPHPPSWIALRGVVAENVGDVQLLRSSCCHGIQINGARVHAALPSADAGAVPASIQLLNPARLLAAECTAPYHGDVVTAVFLKMRV